MEAYIIDRDTVIRRIAQNVAESTDVSKDELADKMQAIFTELSKMDSKDLIACLLESHQLREGLGDKRNYYPVDMRGISAN